MSDASIMVTWGGVFAGRETMGLTVFQSAIGFYSEQKAKGNITEFKVGIAEVGAISSSAGYMLIEGSVDQLRKLVDSEDYKRILTKAVHVVPMNVSHNVTGNTVMQSVERLVSVRNELGIK
ncbi:MAG: hypothetical protein IPI67_10825 [Myxococcales bacterium]|nr:hypothetical protein [Myxococcales bacterium]